MTASSSTPTTIAQWHTISPHTRPLTLTILELTPLALTLSLSLTPPPVSQGQGQPHTPSQHLVHNNHHTHAHSPSHPKSKKRLHGPSHTPRGKRGGGELSEEDEIEESDYSALVETSSFKDLLSHGVVVSVNGQPWSRIYAHVSEDEDDETDWEDDVDSSPAGEEVNEDGMEEGSVTRRRPRKARFGLSAAEASSADKDLVLANQGRRKIGKDKIDTDRAVVVIYGLSPGKEYEVELRVVGLLSQEGGEGMFSTSVLIPPSPTPGSGLHPRSRANSLRSRSRPRSRSNSLTASSPGHPGSHSITSPLSHTRIQDAAGPLDSANPTSHDTLSPESAAIMPTPILNAVDTQTAHLRHLIATAHAEKDHLQTQIKEGRRTSQRQEAALKAEIEAVKKAIEKAGSMDMRSKQKALATQEQVKQGWAGAESAEKDAGDVQSGLDTLESRLEALRIEVEAIKEEWQVVKDREEDLRERDKRSRAEEDKRLTEVVGKIDKLKTKKVKKETEKADLEKKLEELEKQCDEAEKKNEEERQAKRGAAAYWAAGYGQQGHNDHVAPGAQRSLSAHPSLNGLSGQYAAGPAYRPRGVAGYQPRFPSAGAAHHHNRPAPSQPSPTHPNNFYPIQHPIPSSTTSPAFRPPKLANSTARSSSGPTPGAAVGSSSFGVNAAALPFHPSNFSPSNTTSPSPHDSASNHTTSLMPPQLQHRIYLPNGRPRPTPNFHPPPSVLAEQAKASTASSSGSGSSPAPSALAHGAHPIDDRSPRHSPPAFPPLPAVGSKAGSALSVHNGPSLASIITRAVLSPTSALAQQAQGTEQGSVASSILKHPSTAMGVSGASTNITPSPNHSSSSTPPVSTTNQSNFQPQHRSSYPLTGSAGGGKVENEFAPLSPTWGPGIVGHAIRRESTPPAGAIWGSNPVAQAGGRESPIPGLVLKKGSGSGSGSGSAATTPLSGGEGAEGK